MKRHLFMLLGLWFLVAGFTSPAFRGAADDAAQQIMVAQGVTFTMPNLFGMQKEQALVELKKTGHRGTVDMDTTLCPSVVEGRIIELGEVCYQRPAAGQVMGIRLPISLKAQTRDPRHGSIGTASEWHLMPDVRGMSIEQARQALRDHGLTKEDTTRVQYVKDSGCASGKVCRTYPEPMKGSGLNDTRILYVGGEPGAR